ncbi:glutamate racemase [Patescibacteria group bacterium]|nr:glutamate racemase [Patescibacteria group bacterium]
MKIGVFDSGLGGLILLKAIVKKLPQYDYIYLGDTQRVPYGNRSQTTIYEFTREAVDFLFKKNCQLIIVACNTASAVALRRIQREYLPKYYSNRRVLGVIIPTAETAAKFSPVGVLATESTVNSGAFVRELKKLNPKVTVYQQSAPLLVPLVENNAIKWAKPILKDYLSPLLKRKVKGIILGCTHYPLLKSQIKNLAPEVKIISQDEVIPAKLADYLKRHPEMGRQLSRNGRRELYVTDLTENIQVKAKSWFGEAKLRLAKLGQR